jgi:AbrB family looped-hinge helix DNA binding protein
MLEVRATIGGGGRLLIPSEIRKKLHFEEGEEVILRVKAGELHILTLKDAVKRAQSLVKKYNPQKTSLTKYLFKLRRDDKNE